jgi:DNA polymerase-3 subunit delta'
MAGFSEIIGQEKVIEHFQNAIKRNKISHAYILNGESGMGKKMLAKAFAMTVQCEQGGDEPCMKCHSCIQALSGNNPDIRWITHEKPASIAVEDIRTQVNNDIVIRPYEYRRKIYICDEAEKMTAAAQNALLKTIEEPPEYGIIMLLTANKQMLLDTILSRCVVMEMRPVKEDIIVDYLKTKERVVDYRAREAAAFSGGNIGKAKELCASDEFFSFKDDVLRMIKNVEHMTAAEIQASVREIVKENKDNIGNYLNLLELWYRDVLIYKVSQNGRELLFQKEEKAVRNQADKAGYDDVERIMQSIAGVRGQIKSNVNLELALEMMFVKIRDSLQ